MTEWVRVRDTSGHHISVRADVPEGHPRGVQPGQQVLKQDALDNSGAPRTPTYRTGLGDKPAPSAQIKAKPRKTRKATATTKAATEPVPDAEKAEPEATTSGQELADTGRQD